MHSRWLPIPSSVLALLNLGLVELLEVRLDDRAVELPANAAEVGENGPGRQAPQRRVEQLAQLVVLGVLVGFDSFVVLLARSPLRPLLALVGDGHPNLHVMDANAG